MNLLPLAAFLIACLALAVSIWVLVIVERLRRRPRRHLTRVSGDGSTQLQSGGTLIIPAEVSLSGREVKIDLSTDPEETARRVSARMGRHL